MARYFLLSGTVAFGPNQDQHCDISSVPTLFMTLLLNQHFYHIIPCGWGHYFVLSFRRMKQIY